MHRAWKVVLAVLVVILGVFVAVYVFRDDVATYALNERLEDQPGLRCSRTQVEIASDLQHVTIAPLTCRVSEGPIASVETAAPAHLTLDGLRVVRVEVEAASMNARQRDTSQIEGDVLADLSQVVGLRDRLASGMLDASEMYSGQSPVISVARFRSMRGGHVEGVLIDYTVEPHEGWLRSHAERLETGGGPSVRDFEMQVKPDRGWASMDIYLDGFERGDDPDITLRMQGHRLDEERPRFALSI